MRAEKSANLIYNGGKKGSPSKEAEVSIWFENSDNSFPIPEKEVKISRIVRASGQSIYRINDNTRTRQEVVELLNSAKIDPDGYNIILQGDIIHFTEMKPVERRKIIEEAAGISVYEERKEKALSELEKVERKISDAEIVMKERSANLRELKKERDQAVDYKKVEEKIKSDKATYFTLHVNQKKSQQEQMEAGMEKQKKAIQDIRDKVTGVLKDIEKKKQEIEELNRQIEIRGEKEQLQIHREIDTIKEDMIKKSMRLETCRNELLKLKQRNHQLGKDTAEIDKKISTFNKDILQVESKKEALESQKGSLMDEIDSFSSAPKKTSNLPELQKEVSALSEEKTSLLRQIDRISFQLAEIEKSLSQITSSKTAVLRKKFSEISRELSAVLNKDAEFSLKISTLRESLNSKNEELAKLTTRDIIFKEKSQSSFPVKSILESGIKGVHNTIAELGEINKKHSLAFQVAAGSRLNAIVVKDDITAEKCIQHLKKTRSGTAILLPLNKVRPVEIPLEQRKLLSIKGVEGFAIDLVKFSPEFKNAFSNVLGSTLIVDEIPTARKIGIGKARMVTLEGDLMETSGVMVGGYRKLTQSFKEKDLSGSIEKLDAEIKKMESSLSSLQEDRLSNDEKIQELRKQKAELESEIIKSEKTSGLFDPAQLKKQQSELLSQSEELSGKLKQLEQSLKSKSKELEKQSNASVQDAGEFMELKELQNSLQEVSLNYANLESEIKSIKMQVSMMEAEKAKIQAILKTNEKSSEEFQQELSSLEEGIESQKKELRKKEAQEKEFYVQFKEMFSKRDTINESVKQKEILNATYEEKISAMENRINALSIERARIIGELEGLQEELEPFKNEPVRHGIGIPQLKVEIQQAEKTLQGMGNVNLRALEVYEELEKEFGVLTDKIEKLKVEKEDVLGMMTEIESKKGDLFMKTFNSISENFQRIFEMISTKGASAHLEIEDANQLFESGVDIKVRIKGNRFLDIRSLSGGEKTLTALAFIFAIQEHSPSSFYILDEVDAALDKANSEKLSKLIAQYSKNAQYIVISHNDAIITEADQVYGVSMQDGVSKVISLKI
jgi:chromosome segregation protein